MSCCCTVTTADAGDDQVVCSSSTFLSANLPAIGCGRWSTISGGGTFKNPKKYNTRVTNLPDGVSVFRWTVKNCDCPCGESSVDDVTITNACE